MHEWKLIFYKCEDLIFVIVVTFAKTQPEDQPSTFSFEPYYIAQTEFCQSQSKLMRTNPKLNKVITV